MILAANKLQRHGSTAAYGNGQAPHGCLKATRGSSISGRVLPYVRTPSTWQLMQADPVKTACLSYFSPASTAWVGSQAADTEWLVARGCLCRQRRQLWEEVKRVGPGHPRCIDCRLLRSTHTQTQHRQQVKLCHAQKDTGNMQARDNGFSALPGCLPPEPHLRAL